MQLDALSCGGIARDAAMGTLVRDHRTRHRYGHHRAGETELLDMLERFFAPGPAECAERLNKKTNDMIISIYIYIYILWLPLTGLIISKNNHVVYMDVVVIM